LYATREDVMSAADVRPTAQAGKQIDNALAAASEQVDRLCHRGARARGIPGFAPWTGTLTFDWPNPQTGTSWSMWLNQHSLISVITLSSGGVAIPQVSVFLEPSASGPPYNRLTLDRATTSGYFQRGSGVGQRAISITGVWGYTDTEQTVGTVSTAISSTTGTSVVLSATVGVGDILRIDSERLIVTEKTWSASGQTLADPMTASNADQSLQVSNGAAFLVGEQLMVDSETVEVLAITGNTLVVKRAVLGSTLAAHTTSATVWWARTFIVSRGALGTTAATHSLTAPVYRHRVPDMVRELTVAYALDTYYQRGSGYSRTIGSGEGERPASGGGIRALEERVYGAYGRRVRMRAV
jgi:hypothetical protein